MPRPELDYRELKGELCLDHYEGRPYFGLVSPHRALGAGLSLSLQGEFEHHTRARGLGAATR